MAKDSGSADCSCSSCVQACRDKPGWLAPGDAERIAAHLDVPVERLFRERLAVDYWVGSTLADPPPERRYLDVLVLSPAAERAPAGAVWPTRASAGACVFLVDDRCSIHAAKPTECRLAGHPTPRNLHRDVAALWETEEGQAQVRALLDGARSSPG